MPRSGLEALGAFYILAPLAALYLIIGFITLAFEVSKKRWRVPLLFVVLACLMAFSWYLYGSLKPTYRPLHRALKTKYHQVKRDLIVFKEQKALERRKALERQNSASHADLCDSLQYPVDLELLEKALKGNPDLSRSCVLIRDREATPLFVLLGENVPAWARDRHESRAARLADISSAAKLLIQAGGDPNLQNKNGETPLHYALEYNDEQLVSAFLDAGACVYLADNSGQTVLDKRAHRDIGKRLKAAAEDPQMTLNCPQIFQQKRGASEKSSPAGQERLSSEDLFRAVRRWNISDVATVLSKGADPNERDKKGQTPLHLVAKCRSESPALIEMLLKAGAEIDSQDSKGYTPLITAARNHCPDMVSMLLDKGADHNLVTKNGETAMHWLARWSADRLPPALEALLAAGADIDARDKFGRTPLMMTRFAPVTGDAALPLFLAKGADPAASDHQGDTLLHKLAADSAKEGRLKSVATLLAAGLDLEQKNSQLQTPLMLAVKGRKAGIAELLLHSGASPDVTRPRGTPLLHSVVSCQPEKLALLELLLRNGADVNLPNQGGQTALHRAAMNYLHVSCNKPLERLLQVGAEANILDQNGTAPLHNIAYWEKKDVAAALTLFQKAGADIDIRDSQGLTPLLRTARHGKSSLVLQALLDAGANPDAVDLKGNTLLHSIAMNPAGATRDSIGVILAVFGKTDIRNKSGQTALDLAKKYGQEILPQMLMDIEKGK